MDYPSRVLRGFKVFGFRGVSGASFLMLLAGLGFLTDTLRAVEAFCSDDAAYSTVRPGPGVLCLVEGTVAAKFARLLSGTDKVEDSESIEEESLDDEPDKVKDAASDILRLFEDIAFSFVAVVKFRYDNRRYLQCL